MRWSSLSIMRKLTHNHFPGVEHSFVRSVTRSSPGSQGPGAHRGGKELGKDSYDFIAFCSYSPFNRCKGFFCPSCVHSLPVSDVATATLENFVLFNLRCSHCGLVHETMTDLRQHLLGTHQENRVLLRRRFP